MNENPVIHAIFLYLSHDKMSLILALGTGEDHDAAVVRPLVHGVDLRHVGTEVAEHQLKVRRVAGLQLPPVGEPPHFL